AATAAEPVALEAIGSAEAGDAGARALRDLANLTLGYHWLREGAGDKAKPVLARVRSPGPYGNAALLGFGWAFLVPEAAEQRPAMFDPALPLWPDGAAQAAELRRSLPFRYLHSVAVGGERLLDLRRALVPWVELLGRDATDPAVQEGMLVVPYALAHLGANAQAQQYTRRAVTQLQQARSELEAAMHHVGEGGLLRVLRQHQAAQQDGWQRELADLRGPAETSYIARLAQNGEVLAAIDAQCELLQLELLLQRQAAALPDAAAALVVQHAALRSRVDNALQQQGAALETLALAELKRGLQHTLAYLAEAHLALARIHDRPLEGENS
ncbi:MAG TPA: hypothetical protein VLI06_09935, partial [Solimonas sp.]|nr:hypothetical protein [Solimonas sp.]